MKALVCTLVGALLAAPVHAANSYGTVEVTLTDANSTSVSLISGTSSTVAVDGAYQLLGTTVGTSDGKSTPVEVIVPEAVTPEMAFAAAKEMGIELDERFATQFAAGDVKISKAVYSISGKRLGTMVITDDPIPIIVYVLVAGVALVVATETAAAALCDGDYKRRIEIKPLQGKFVVESECVKK